MAGYSGTPLVKKLGIRDGHRVAFIGAPASFADALDPLPEGVEHAAVAAKVSTPIDVAVLFVSSRADLLKHFEGLRSRLDPKGGLWIAWPKRASGVATDMTEQVARDVILPTGLVDNKVCAIDEIWSGLRFVVRLEDRPKARR